MRQVFVSGDPAVYSGPNRWRVFDAQTRQEIPDILGAALAITPTGMQAELRYSSGLKPETVELVASPHKPLPNDLRMFTLAVEVERDSVMHGLRYRLLIPWWRQTAEGLTRDPNKTTSNVVRKVTDLDIRQAQNPHRMVADTLESMGEELGRELLRQFIRTVNPSAWDPTQPRVDERIYMGNVVARKPATGGVVVPAVAAQGTLTPLVSGLHPLPQEWLGKDVTVQMPNGVEDGKLVGLDFDANYNPTADVELITGVPVKGINAARVLGLAGCVPPGTNATPCPECGGSGEWTNPANGAVSPCSLGCKKPRVP